jgi:hypothetical protein
MNKSYIRLPRLRPRISVCKLAEYLEAQPIRRHQILKDQKYPPDFKVTWYDDSFDAAVNGLTNPDRALDLLRSARAEMAAKPALNEKQLTARTNNLEALNHLINFLEKPLFPDCTLRRVPDRPSGLRLAGVNISVRPEIEIVVGGRGQAIHYGYLKLYISKTHPISEEGGKYVATAVHQFAVLRHGLEQAVDRKHCCLLDAFRERLHEAPQHFQARRRQIEAACREIASQWPTL